MKLGILVYRQYPYISANTSIAYTIGEELAGRQGIEVVYIGRRQDESQRDVTEYRGVPIRFLNELPWAPPTLWQNRAAKILGQGWLLRTDIAALKRIAAEERFDALICFTAPNEDAYIAYYAKLDIPVYLYQLDPFYNLMTECEDKRLKRHFVKMLNRFEGLFTTDYLWNGYTQDNRITPYLTKIEPMKFPKLVHTVEENHTWNAPNKLSLLYMGTVSGQWQNIDVLAELQKCMELMAGTPVKFNLCGSVAQEDIERLDKIGIVYTGYLGQKDLAEEMDRADVLINVGNTKPYSNQLRSKIVDYVATGRPILNITQFDECPTASFLEPYPLKLVVSREELNVKVGRERVVAFLREMRGKRVPWEDVRKLYKEYTPEYVADKLMTVITKGV